MIAEVETEVYPETVAPGGYESTVTEVTAPDAPSTEATSPRSRARLYVIGLVAFVVVAIGVGWYLYSLGYESTDDAQVDGHLNPIAARIDGTIKAVHVDDNQSVAGGYCCWLSLIPTTTRSRCSRQRRNMTKRWPSLAPRTLTFLSRVSATLTI